MCPSGAPLQGIDIVVVSPETLTVRRRCSVRVVLDGEDASPFGVIGLYGAGGNFYFIAVCAAAEDGGPPRVAVVALPACAFLPGPAAGGGGGGGGGGGAAAAADRAPYDFLYERLPEADGSASSILVDGAAEMLVLLLVVQLPAGVAEDYDSVSSALAYGNASHVYLFFRRFDASGVSDSHADAFRIDFAERRGHSVEEAHDNSSIVNSSCFTYDDANNCIIGVDRDRRCARLWRNRGSAGAPVTEAEPWSMLSGFRRCAAGACGRGCAPVAPGGAAGVPFAVAVLPLLAHLDRVGNTMAPLLAKEDLATQPATRPFVHMRVDASQALLDVVADLLHHAIPVFKSSAASSPPGAQCCAHVEAAYVVIALLRILKTNLFAINEARLEMVGGLSESIQRLRPVRLCVVCVCVCVCVCVRVEECALVRAHGMHSLGVLVNYA